VPGVAVPPVTLTVTGIGDVIVPLTLTPGMLALPTDSAPEPVAPLTCTKGVSATVIASR
jgi:hypothetical protein